MVQQQIQNPKAKPVVVQLKKQKPNKNLHTQHIKLSFVIIPDKIIIIDVVCKTYVFFCMMCIFLLSIKYIFFAIK
jgi:hypothetical protein